MKKAAQATAADIASSHADILKDLQDRSKDDIIALLLKHLKDEHHASDEQIRALLAEQETRLPGAIFANDKLSGLETIVKFLKENKSRKLHEIAVLLNRDDRSIWTTYNNARKKMKEALATTPSAFFVPADIFAERRLSVLETLATHLKESGMTLHEIAVALHRDDRTIWTVCKRAEKKGGAA